ncbi:putative RNA recognition motif domain, nucleotide-binding alpha-beta plait domain superfamily [Helianthus annuus]|uniref:RNA recognition motif domain, nucleotide-binding alpha-beta plait domain superfamily n=1 Tax=Helianthus annuus TaxID=4232 RepID=A0A9K3JBJ5_HELAN|nr:uncharacterized protein LOC110934112 [Helianthus annuus]KAF5811794.1 putative RNA recognition motif domain, nucleotide-binding alpha-beta plait domain superfamily [Helianthus annuus]KAJ0582420.1 putative RNA recognition motif domain, nucleotide-binding alpha-beta plait domain superfamily [Helianthus annuus]KAJ0590653.1 putative RNA recognition motif domain, nucleotide-binding alpha-beta plait domain superfamily [Helianthus annuus]KAJ0598402.1 putative RNA recognition motif domain, nucleotide
METEDDSWEIQNRSRRGKGAATVGFNPGATKFFVTNIPQGCRPWDLANVFRDFGVIAGAFIAKKKDKDGRIFGFVSFKDVRDVEELKNNISKVKLGGNKLMINVALFAKESGAPRSDVVNGGKSKVANAGHVRVQAGFPKVSGSNPVKKGVSFLDILTNKSYSDWNEDAVVVDPSIFSLSNLSGKAVVGRMLGFDELRFLNSPLKVAGFEGASLQYLGGLSVLISFEDGDVTKRLLEAKEVWIRWFSALSPWLGQSLPFERLAWINIRGVPPHFVSRRVFNMIGSRYGKVVQPSQFLETNGDLTFDRLGILIDTGNKINGVLNPKLVG